MVKVEFYFETAGEAQRVIQEVGQTHQMLHPPSLTEECLTDIYDAYEHFLNDDTEIGGEA